MREGYLPEYKLFIQKKLLLNPPAGGRYLVALTRSGVSWETALKYIVELGENNLLNVLGFTLPDDYFKDNEVLGVPISRGILNLILGNNRAEKIINGDLITTNEVSQIIKSTNVRVRNGKKYILANLRCKIEESKQEKLLKELNDYVEDFKSGNIKNDSNNPRNNFEQCKSFLKEFLDSHLSKFTPFNVNATAKDIELAQNFGVIHIGDNSPFLREFPFFETMLEAEQRGSILIKDIHPEGKFIFDIIKGDTKKTEGETAINLVKKQYSDEADKKIHWYCRVCGDLLSIADNPDSFQKLLSEFSQDNPKNCSNGHKNWILESKDNLIFSVMCKPNDKRFFKKVDRKS